MQKFESTENIPKWSLPYLINDDPSGLTDEEIKMVDDFVNQWQVQVVSPIEWTAKLNLSFPIIHSSVRQPRLNLAS